jgi:membrane-associated phospholipid phosphatase
MNTITDFGDAAVVLPLSAVMLVWLLRLHARRAAVSWVIAVSLCIVGTGLLKILLYVCPPAPDLVSPSGHTSLSTLIVGIAGSRLVLNVHSALEVGVGLLIGSVTLALFASRYLRLRSEENLLRSLILPTIAVIALLHGHELRAEDYLHAISRYLHLGGKACGG